MAARDMKKEDYWDLGADTERWWREHVKTTIPHLRHITRCRGYDFKGDYEGETLLIDCKFLREEYREKGWIEIKTWGKITGIMETAKEHYHNPKVNVYLAVMAHGHHYLYDVKSIITAIQDGSLPLVKGKSIDDTGAETDNVHVVMKGWNDPRFLILSGPMKTQLWKPKTQIGRDIIIEKWMEGVWETV